ncbi:MFS transporter [Kitasatospora sp. NPDC006697]|uniref:MFS transporter n=1 Tax=Kitasatospora sp. NPDC006697 TaxID=3364020 RepID=UPI0036C00231
MISDNPAAAAPPGVATSPGLPAQRSRPTAPAAPVTPERRLPLPLLRAVAAGGGVALLVGVVWAVFLAGPVGDLSAQAAWSDFAARHPGAAYDFGWYGGIHPASYSLLTPYLMAALGVLPVAVAAATASGALLAVLVARSPVRRPALVSAWGGLAMASDIVAGRATFAVGLAFALAAAVVALPGPGRPARWPRLLAAGALAALATLGSPVAGLFVEVLAAALLLTRRRRLGLALALPPPVLVVGTSLAFPFGGVYPIPVSTTIYTTLCALAVALLVPGRWRAVRIGAWLYAAGTLATTAVTSPIGGNVQRLGLLFGGVVLLGALCSEAWAAAGRWKRVALALACALAMAWTVNADLRGNPSPPPAGTADGLLAELRARHADQARVESVPRDDHWDAWRLLPTVELARGWNRQADVELNAAFYDGSLTADRYHDWLRKWSVRYVVLPNAKLDTAGKAEGKLVAARPSWLTEVWHDPHWTLFEFTDAQPMVDAPAVVDRADDGSVLLTVPAAGSVTVRVPWSPWLTVHGPAGACLAQDGDWTRLTAAAPGQYRIDGRYSWPRGSACHG